MAILNPDHLLEQADQLILPPTAGPPRQVNLRRAISSAYYAVFHALITAAADQIVGEILRASREHALVCRSIDHRTIKELCQELTKTTVAAKYLPFLPAPGFGPGLIGMMSTFPDLQEQRHAADYDTLRRFRTSDASAVIATARGAITQFASCPSEERKSFLFMLVVPPRRG